MQYGENVRLAFQGLIDHKFRSFLTMLGIIFGVASVITMLSIGEGAKRKLSPNTRIWSKQYYHSRKITLR